MTKREAMKQLRWRQNAEAFTHKLEEPSCINCIIKKCMACVCV